MTADKHAYLCFPCSHPHSFFSLLFTCFARRRFYFFAIFVAFVLADIPELPLAPNRSGSMSLVYEGRAYKLKCADKKGCGGSIWTNLVVTSVIKQKTKPIPAIYDEEASATSAVPLTFRHFPPFKLVKSTMYSHRSKQYPDHITSEPI
ncbi:hypothetical protein T4B_5686 [Trichinella pseudospiralis]|uniref:FLYWCH-type domain-containing protein n=1 Tax=Trichinella pseudospiralis TaxID=6337 RepID=A0A0V1ER64_TRIPS|nr:hypothetical protein T4A_2701 [Trichinella pseudospiralis]KRZ23791.1 hypothetical protein T4B_5686 [Trichinella pseudospiralis]KRZ40565.1 hypothetical protein T4C_4123 [Trichinella pseudospiralis]